MNFGSHLRVRMTRELIITVSVFSTPSAHSGPIWITALNCDGSEINLEDCSYRNVTYQFDSYEVHMPDCTYGETAGIACHVPTLKTHQGVSFISRS